jgi:hypothetical protein
MPTRHAPSIIDDVRPTEVTVDLEPGDPPAPPNTRVESSLDTTGATTAEADMTALVTDAATHLGPRTLALIELSVVEGRTDSEVGGRLGIREEIVSATVAHTRERVTEALTIFVLLKTRTRECAELRRMVGAHARASLEAHMGEMVAAHLKTCTGCSDAWGRIPPPLEVLREARAPRANWGRSIWDRARTWIPNSPALRCAFLLTGAAVALALVLVGVGTMGDAVEPRARTLPFLSFAAASPTVENVTPATTPTTIVQQQTEPTVPADQKPGGANETKPDKAPKPEKEVVPSEPPLITVISPFNGQVFSSTFGQQHIELVAVVQDDVDEGLEVDWYEGSTYIGTGNSVTVTSGDGCPSSTTHTVTATVTDSSRNTSTQQATFTVSCENPSD